MAEGDVLATSKDGGAQLIEGPPHPKTKYPLWRIERLEADVVAAQANIDQFTKLIADQEKIIRERREQIAQCEERDRGGQSSGRGDQ